MSIEMLSTEHGCWIDLTLCHGHISDVISCAQAVLGSPVEARDAKGLSMQPRDRVGGTRDAHTRSVISQGPMIVGAQRVTPRDRQVDGLPRAPMCVSTGLWGLPGVHLGARGKLSTW